LLKSQSRVFMIHILFCNSIYMNQEILINSVHVLFTGPFLIYVGLYQPQSIYFYVVLFILAIAIVLAFINRYINKELYAWLFVHLFLFMTLLASTSILRFMDKPIPNYLFSFLLAIGIAAVGYHSIKIVKHFS
jgi:hypothetical protein